MKKRGMFLIGLGVLLLVIVLSGSMFIAKEGEYKVVLRFGEATRIHTEPGIKFKVPFIESVRTLPKYQKVYDSEPTLILTNDKKPIYVDNYTVWRISDPQKFLRSLNTVSNAESRISDAVYNAVRRKLSEIEYGNIISENTARGDLNEEITKIVADVAANQGYGIEVIDVRIKRTDLPPENKESVYNRMISDRQSIAAGYLSEGDEESRKITSNADRQAKELLAEAEAKAKKIIAEGEQEAARIYNEAYGKDPEFYELYRTLESYVKTFEGEPVIMMPIDSPYARLLLGE
ncbi:MAG: protease modulator HflC [Thermobacillus sp.]|jgi:membrane protease subunit HflC|uniref:Protein HflC n=2 Tax=Thermobacillus TaxID=76632 RepID=L0EGJ7_THECK|nr:MULTISPECIES: protease modulator HflC [Thermobacillus]AGA58769.1 membrane protease subunit, stomatin/prohibitin [Thermobacillus composti KWC4]REK54075.1 MAG: protease modulator HflC [Thermobacillus sp.]CAG5091855.1 FtsH protease regulator HflC [Thermobacillus xylanilyticus]